MISPGIHRGLGRDYFALGSDPKRDPANAVLSKSLLWGFAKNPRKWLESAPLSSTAAMRWGSLVDCLALTPEEFSGRYHVGTFPTGRHEDLVGAILDDLEFAESPYPDFRSKAAKQWRDEQEAAGRIIVKEGELEAPRLHADLLERGVEPVTASLVDEAQIAANKLIAHPEVGPLLGSCEKQVAAVAEFVEPVTGIKLRAKCLLDLADFENRRVIDLKTTGKPMDSARLIGRTILDFGYHVQLAWYSCVMEIATGEPWDDYALVFQDSSAPYYTTRPLPVSRDAIDEGKRWIARNLTKWCECSLRGEWDQHDPLVDVEELDIPAYGYERE